LEPVQVTATAIPFGAEPGGFLRGLGYESYAEHEFLQWGPDWVVLRTNTAIRDFRIIELIPRYEARFEDGWRFARRYAYVWTSHIIDFMPGEPFVMTWYSNALSFADINMHGISFVDADGLERFFYFRQDDGVTSLEEFENAPFWVIPEITRRFIDPDIELMAAWFASRLTVDIDVRTTMNGFMQQFDAYTEFANPFWSIDSWLVFSANKDLREFTFFTLGLVCDPMVGGELHPFYVDAVLDSQDVLPFGKPVVVPWHPIGTWPSYGIGFTDENGQRRTFWVNDNTGSGFPPLFIGEFTDRVRCPDCMED
jgi:hypothetical protein